MRIGRELGCAGAARALALCLALALWPQGPRVQGTCSEGAPPAAGLRWALAGVGAGAGGAVGVVDLGDGPRWLPALHARAAAPMLLWRGPHIQRQGCAPQWLEGARGYVLAARSAYRLLYFLFKDTSKAAYDEVYELFAGNSHRNVQLNSAVPIVMAISRPPLQKHHCVQNIFGSRGHRTNRIARHTSQLQRQWAQLTEQLQLLLSGKESAEAQWDEGARRQGQGERVGRMVGEVQEERERERGRWRWSGRGMQWEESERDLKEDLQVLKYLRLEHQSFRGVVLREDAAAATWRGIAHDQATGRKRAYRWKSGGGGGDEGERAAAALLAARTPSPSGFSARAVVFRVYAYANMTFRLRGVQVRLVGYFIPLWEEMRKRYNINISITFLNAPDYLTGTVATDAVEQFILKGTIDLVPQYWKFMAIVGGFTHLFDIVSSGENVRYIVLVPYAPPLPAWTLPLSVFSHRIWLSLLGAAVAYALAWRVVAGESLAASAAAALRAFSSCGGAPQDRVRATPQRLQLAAAMLASAVVVVAVYQGRLFDLITTPQHDAEINTFDQLIKEKMTLLIAQHNIMPEVKEKLSKIPRIVWNNEKEYAAIFTNNTNERYALFYLSELWKTHGATINPSVLFYREMEESVSSFQPHLCSRRNWPWSELLKLLILQMEETGLVSKWKDNYNTSCGVLIRSGVFAPKHGAPQGHSDAPKVLALKDVAAHLQLLCTGLAASALFFCAELWCGRPGGLRRRSRLRAQDPNMVAT